MLGGFLTEFLNHQQLGGGNSNIFFIFTPKNWGNDEKLDEHIFRMGGKKPPTS